MSRKQIRITEFRGTRNDRTFGKRYTVDAHVGWYDTEEEAQAALEAFVDNIVTEQAAPEDA